MREIGGFIEQEYYFESEFHTNCLKLNSGRNCLRYLIRAREIKKIAVPRYCCSSVFDICKEEDVDILYYYIDSMFKPIFSDDILMEDVYIYIINFYGQIDTNYIKKIKVKHAKIIVDNAQAFFSKPIEGIDTLYTCRKFFGVPDGAYLYTNLPSPEDIEKESAYKRMDFLLGRFECNAETFFHSYQNNEIYLSNQKVCKMSKISGNILKSIDYKKVRQIRNTNFKILEESFILKNELKLRNPNGSYMYPLLVANAESLRKKLIEHKIYIPLLWPNVIEEAEHSTLEYRFAMNILPLPCDQRYTAEDMKYMIYIINNLI